MLRKIKDKSKKGYLRRKNRVRFKLRKNLNGKPRLSIFISNLHIYAQVIDDVKGVTLASASTLSKELRSKLSSTSSKEAAIAVGKSIVEKLKSQNISEIVFDRGGNVFHGKVKCLADAAREAGLKF